MFSGDGKQRLKENTPYHNKGGNVEVFGIDDKVLTF